MDSRASSKFIFMFLLSYILMVCSSGPFLSHVKAITQKPTQSADKHKSPSHRRELYIRTSQHDFTPYPTAPVTNPVTTPATGTTAPDTFTPPMITVPSANPAAPIPPASAFPGGPPTNPANPTGDGGVVAPPTIPVPSANPAPIPPATAFPGGPPTNPANPTGDGGVVAPPTITVPSANPAPIPPATTFPGSQPTNPANPTGGGGVVAPPAVGMNAPAVPGQSWCVARGGLAENVLQVGLDYACGIGGADCSTIQQGASCYNPNTLENHASYAFNSYYQKNPVQTSCDFGGAAMVTNVNPSSGSCIFPTWSSSSGSPATVSPTTADPISAPATDSTYGAPPISTGSPPTMLNPSNPTMGGGINGYGDSPPTSSVSSASMATRSMKSVIACVVLALPFITGSIGHSIY